MEGNPDVIFAVDRDEVAHCVPGAFLKVIDLLRQRPQHLHEVLHHLSLSLAAWLPPTAFHPVLPLLHRILKRHIYRSSFRSLGVWFLWLPRFHTGRVINVPAELIFYCQVTWSFYSPYTCIRNDVRALTTIYF